MKQKNLRTLLIVCLLLGAFTLGAAASIGVKDITATLRPDITVKVDGESQTLYDKNGDVVYPLMYNGSTYLPIRAISTLLDQDVVWDSKTQTVSLSDKTDTAPEDLTYSALNKRINKLESRYVSLSDDVKATAKAGTYAENLTIYHAFHDRHLDLTDTLKSLQVDVSEAYRTDSITKTNRDTFLTNLDSLDSKLAILHTSVLEKYGIDGDAATFKALRAEALDLQGDQKELADLVSAAVKAKTVSDWKSADASARKEWKSFRNDVTALQVALNDSLRQSVISYQEYNEVSELAGALDVACKDLKSALDKAEANWDGSSESATSWQDRDGEYYAHQIQTLSDKADDLFDRCRDYFTGKNRDEIVGVSLMAEVDKLDDQIDDLEDAIEDSQKLGRQTRWALLRDLDKADNTLSKAEDFLEKAGIDDDWDDDHDRGWHNGRDDDDDDDDD